jgi:OmpA-OmpF porin, OOP family
VALDVYGEKPEARKERRDMSLLTDLFSTLDKRSLTGISSALGEPEQSVSRGIQTSIATVLGGLASKSDNHTLFRRILDMAPSDPGGVSWTNLASGVADPSSPLMTTGKNMLSTLFGGSESTIMQGLSSGTGLRPGIMSSLLGMAAPMVMSFLAKRVRDQGMSMGGLGSLLQHEIPAIREILPTGVADTLLPRAQETVTASPVVAQTVSREKSAAGWLIPLALLALIPLIWLFSRGPRTPVVTPMPVTGTANRVAPEVPQIPKPAVPQMVILYFDTGSTRLKPESQARLNEFAGAVANNRDARVTVNGYTDNVGKADSNMQLSQERANAVKAELVHDGISADRLTAQGFGEENPIADNASAEGRGRNRHVSVGVGQQ